MRRTHLIDKTYKIPAVDEIRLWFAMLGYDNQDYSVPFVQDLAITYSTILMGLPQIDCFRDLDRIIKVEQFDGDYKQFAECLKYNKDIQEFLSKIDFAKFSGTSPLQKAVAIMSAIIEVEKMENGGKKKVQWEAITDPMSEEEKQKAKAQQGEKAPEDDDGEGDGNGDSEGKGEGQNEKEGQGNGSGDGQDQGKGQMNYFKPGSGSGKDIGQRVTQLERVAFQVVQASKTTSVFDVLHNNPTPESAISKLSKKDIDIIEKLSILNSLSFQSRKKGHKQTQNMMRNYDELPRLVSKVDLLKPDFKLKFAKKDLVVNNHEQGGKQSLFLMIDNSGSMADSGKVAWVKAIVMNRMEAVIKGKAELYIGWFVESVSQTVFAIKNPKQAREFLDKNFYGEFKYGSTNIENCLVSTMAQIKTGRIQGIRLPADIRNVEIVVINDGQDTINPDLVLPYKAHAILLGAKNKDLEQVILRSKGIYHPINIFDGSDF